MSPVDLVLSTGGLVMTVLVSGAIGLLGFGLLREVTR